MEVLFSIEYQSIACLYGKFEFFDGLKSFFVYKPKRKYYLMREFSIF